MRFSAHVRFGLAAAVACVVTGAATASAEPAAPAATWPAPPPHPALLPTRLPPLPERMRVIPGEPPPPGYEVDTETDWPLALGGVSAFAATYLPSMSLAGASERNGFGALFVPVVGPFVALGTASPDNALSVVLVMDGLAQALGVGLFTWALLEPDEVLVRRSLPRFRAAPLILPPPTIPGSADASALPAVGVQLRGEL